MLTVNRRILLGAALAAPAILGSRAGRAQGAPLRVATVGPLTGQYAAFGAQMRNGAEQVVTDLNAAGGVEVGHHLLRAVAHLRTEGGILAGQRPDRGDAQGRALGAAGTASEDGGRGEGGTQKDAAIHGEHGWTPFPRAREPGRLRQGA